jgi:hypothetical protein
MMAARFFQKRSAVENHGMIVTRATSFLLSRSEQISSEAHLATYVIVTTETAVTIQD